MSKKLFIKVDEIAEQLGVSKSHAYKIMQQLNDELSEKGFITVSGRVSRKYFYEKVYGADDQIDEQKGA